MSLVGRDHYKGPYCEDRMMFDFHTPRRQSSRTQNYMYVLIQAFVWGFHTKVHPKTIHVYFHAFKTVLRSYSTQGIHYQIQIRASCEISNRILCFTRKPTHILRQTS